MLLILEVLQLHRLGRQAILKFKDCLRRLFLKFFDLQSVFFSDLCHLIFVISDNLIFIRLLEIEVCNVTFYICIDIVHEVYQSILCAFFGACAVATAQARASFWCASALSV